MNKWMFLLSAVLALLFLSHPAYAGLYKYKDAEGNWVFTDKPPATTTQQQQPPDTPVVPQKKQDLGKSLQNEFQPVTPIEIASLAVVQIKTPSGVGSGFFITKGGHIITNRHVVRPELSEDTKSEIKDIEKELNQYKATLKRYKKRLASREKELMAYRKLINRYHGSDRRALEEDYKYTKEGYDLDKKEYKELKKEFDKKNREFKAAKNKYMKGQRLARASRRFDVKLKNGQTILATLMFISKSNDLALLKIEGYESPMLNAADMASLSQGMRIYAIGSPLGESDAVTSGVLTKIKDDLIMTDTTVMPGNSGGPLITEDGKVIGINTLLVKRSDIPSGFGVAIPIIHALKEVSHLLR